MRQTSLAVGKWNFITRAVPQTCTSDIWIRAQFCAIMNVAVEGLMFRVFLACMLIAGAAVAQDGKSTPSDQKPSSTPAANSSPSSAAQGASSDKSAAVGQKTTPLVVSRAQRLGAAKSAFIKKVEGSEIPVNVITNSLEGWGRYMLVSGPEKADLIIEISSPEEQPSSVTITGSHNNPLTGYPEQSTSTSHNLSMVPIKMTVFDAKSKLPLWSATEQPKRAMKQKSREDNLVEAAENLFMKFHHAVEPNTP
jgi:hypothetical protein